MIDATPSICKQGWHVRPIEKGAVLAYNSGLAVRGDRDPTVIAARELDPERRQCDIVLYELHARADCLPAARIGSMGLPRPGNCELEDCRLIRHGGRWYAAYTEGYYSGPAFVSRQALALLKRDMTFERAIALPYGGNLEPHEVGTSEKNWQFFSHEGRLLFIPSISPHVILEVDVRDGGMEMAGYSNPPICWLHGTMRGGTPPVRVGDVFVSFFHSHTAHPSRQRRYTMSAYCFEARPPFRIVGITRPLLKASAADPHTPNPKHAHWNPLVVFPTGAHFSANTGKWAVVAGVNDSYDVMIHLDHAKLEFIPIEQWARPQAWHFRTENPSLPIKAGWRRFEPWKRLNPMLGVLRTTDPDIISNAEAMPGVSTITEPDYEALIQSR